jgi:hypothetical protein
MVEINFKHFYKWNTQTIKDTILKDPLLSWTIKANALDCYNNHALFAGTHTPAIKNMISRRIGVILSEIKNIQILRLGIVNGQGDNAIMDENRIQLMKDRIEQSFIELPSQEYFERLSLEPDPDVFFETLAISLNNAALSFRSDFYKIKNAQKKNLRETILNLKSYYNANKNLIFDLELRLSTIVDLELKDELALIKKFERLNDEKITPYFLKLAKTPESGSTLSDIKNDDDQIFVNEKERHSYITGVPRRLYFPALQ